MLIERKAKLVKQENGVTLVKNVYTDKKREYTKAQGFKKKAILDQYTYAAQLNELRKVVIQLADANAIDATTLKNIDSLINQ